VVCRAVGVEIELGEADARQKRDSSESGVKCALPSDDTTGSCGLG